MIAARFATAVALCIGLGACAASQGSGNDLVDALADAQADPERRLNAEVSCERALSRRGGDFPFQAFSAGLLAVPEARGYGAFCAALVEAVIAGGLTEDDLAAFQRPKESRGSAPVGNLLRAVIEAHERLSALEAQRPPQAQSCGCGQ